MGNEEREQAAPATPILDSILPKLQPIGFKQEISLRLNVVTQAYDRLSKRMDAGTLTQRDIENELSILPADVYGIIDGKIQLVRLVQMNIPNYDIKSLPVE